MGSQRAHACGLRGAHDGAHVVLTEYSLDGHPIRAEIRESGGDRLIDATQPGPECDLGVGSNNLDVHQRQSSARGSFDHADTAASQPGVHSQHPHGTSDRRPDTSFGHVFEEPTRLDGFSRPLSTSTRLRVAAG